MKIAILGGSFDPPHIGHLFISRQIKELLGVDQIWLMPLFEKSSQDKVFHKKLTDVATRLSMAKLLENDFIKVSDFEIEHNQASFTIDTLRELQKRNPDDTFYWILGSDQLEDFQRYHKWQELVKNYQLIIFPREHMLWHLTDTVKNALQLQTIPENVIVLNNKNLFLTNISSTMIRERVKKGQTITGFVPPEVEDCIKKHKLYE